MKVLSLPASGEVAEQENESLRGPAAAAAAAARQQMLQPRPSARRTLLRAFGVVRQDDPVPSPLGLTDTGMEDGVLGRMQGQDLTGQMKEFYSAYSRVRISPPLPPSVFFGNKDGEEEREKATCSKANHSLPLPYSISSCARTRTRSSSTPRA